jgi:hypothetical protein
MYLVVFVRKNRYGGGMYLVVFVRKNRYGGGILTNTTKYMPPP